MLDDECGHSSEVFDLGRISSSLPFADSATGNPNYDIALQSGKQGPTMGSAGK